MPPTEAPPVDPAEINDRAGAAASNGQPPEEPAPGQEPAQEPAEPAQEPEEGQPGQEPEEPEPAAQEDDFEIVLEGSTNQLSFAVGGKKPTASELKLQGGSIGLEGQFSKGETIVLRVEVRVGEVAFVDKIDSKTGQPVGSTRRHKARIVAAVRE